MTLRPYTILSRGHFCAGDSLQYYTGTGNLRDLDICLWEQTWPRVVRVHCVSGSRCLRSLTLEIACWAVYTLALSYQSGPLLVYFVLFSIVSNFYYFYLICNNKSQETFYVSPHSRAISDQCR